MNVKTETIHVVFDGPPGPVAGRFVEVENSEGKSLGTNVGRWTKRDDGYWVLEIERAVTVPEPDHCYDPDAWECTFTWENRDDMFHDGHVSHLDAGEVEHMSTLFDGPDKFAVNVVTRRDADGDAEEFEIRWFDDVEAARAASLL